MGARPRWLAVLVAGATAAAVAACGGGSGDGDEGASTSTTTASEPAPTLEDVRVATAAFELDLLRAQGAVDDLGAELEPTLSALHDGLAAVFQERAVALEADFGIGPQPRQAPPGIDSGSSLYLQAVQLDAALEAALNVSRQQPVSHSEGGTSVEGSVGEVTLTETSSSNHGASSATTGSRVHARPCPDAEGRASAEITVFADLTVQGRGGTYGSHVELAVDLETVADDNADLLDFTYEIDSTAEDFAEGGGSSAEAMATITMRSGEAYPTVTGSGGRADAPFLEHMQSAVYVWAQVAAVTAAHRMEREWQSGRCVDVRPTTTPGRRTGLAPDTEVEITVDPVARVDGARTGGTATATLTSGEAAVEPDGAPIGVADAFTYTAPDARDEEGSVRLETRSRRGVGRATLDFDTKQRAYVVSGEIEGIAGTGTKCDGDHGEWKLTLTGGQAGITVTMDVIATIDEDGTGTVTIPYTWGGAASGGGSASGPARVELAQDGSGGFLVLGPLQAEAGGSLQGTAIGGSASTGEYRFPVAKAPDGTCA